MLLYIVMLLPLAGGLALPLFRFKGSRARALYVEAVVLATSVLTFALLVSGPRARYDLFTIMDGFTLSFRVDGPGCIFAGLISLLWPLATLYGFEYMAHEERPNTFFAFYTMTYGVTLAVALAANLFTLYVFYECLTLITLPLVTHKKDPKSIRAGRRYLYFSISGAALAFIALVFTMHYGTGDGFALGGMLDGDKITGSEGLLQFVFLLGFIGFGTKAAVFPMFAWLPMASVAPTPVTALLHAVAVVNTGAYAVLRLIYYVFGTSFLAGTAAQYIAFFLSCFTILLGSVLAVKEQHLKRRLAYSTVSNLSYMLMGAALMTPGGMAGSFTHLICHGLIKITLFSCAGAILVRTRHEYVQDLRGLGKAMPFTSAVMAIASLGLVGVPPLCGFISKWGLLSAAVEAQPLLGTAGTITLLVSAVLTAVYLFPVLSAMYFSPSGAALPARNRDPGWMMKLPLALWALMILALGLYSGPLVRFLGQMASGALM